VNANVAIIAAGATFASTVIVGLVAGILLSGRTGQSLWVLAGLGVGLVVGAVSAWRLISRAM